MPVIRKPVSELGPISPELCLIDPELALAARALLPDRSELLEPAAPTTPLMPALPAAPEPRRSGRARAALPRVILVAAALAGLVALVPSAAVRGAVPARLSGPSDDAAVGTTGTGQAVLAVPDVCRLVYVFAKGALQDAGFAWKVEGAVEGYAANWVLRQSPLPGTLVVDTGAPTVTLTLAHNQRYREKGTPEPGAPYPGTDVLLWTPSGADLHPKMLNRCESG